MNRAVRRVAVVLNGKAGALLDDDGSSSMLKASFDEAGLDAEFIPLAAGSLPERVAAAARSGADAVVVAGGDGTVACAAQAMAGSDMPLGILPFGTMNLLAKDLRIPIGDVPAAMRAVAAGQVRAIDVGEVNGTLFLCASMLGLPARLGRHREAARGSRVRLWTRMARAAVRMLMRARRLRLTMTDDGVLTPLRAAAMTVTVNPVDETSGRTFGRTCLDGGTLCIYVVERLRMRDLVRLAPRFALGRWRQDAAVLEREVAAVDFAGGGRFIRVMNDGEISLLAPPLRYRIRPGALHVLAPAA